MPEVEVKQLILGRVELPDFHPEAPGFDTIYGFLVLDADHCILVDTGVGSGSSLIDRLYKPEPIDLEAVLGEMGVSVGEITAIVNSHLHFDHCGNNSLFPGVPILVQHAEIEAAREPHYTVREWVDFPGVNYVPLHGRHSISAHLELYPTPGHTPGHQSLIVRLDDHVDLIVAQAAYTAAEFQRFQHANENGYAEVSDPTLQPYIQSNATWSQDAYVASLASLHRIQPRRAFFSHDPTVWVPAA